MNAPTTERTPARASTRGGRRRRVAPPALAVLLVLGLATFAAGGARGAPRVITATKEPTTYFEMQDEANRLERQIKTLDDQLEVIVEDYDQARFRLDALNADLTRIRLDLERRQAELAATQAEMGHRLTLMYKTGDWGFLDAVLSAGDISDVTTQIDFFRRVSEQDSELQSEYAQLVGEIQDLEAAVAEKRAEALSVAQRVEDEKLVIEDKLAERKSILKGLDQRIKKILKRRAHLDQALARRLARTAGINLSRISGSPAQIAVVQEALKELGKPYVYAAAGPDSFDCSGLVMYVYAKFGVHVPHFAAYQADYGRRVSYGELQPGDLVFFGSPIHHVGIYAGNGLFIHAPHTGDVVKVTVLAQYEMPSACARYTSLIQRIP
jgi:cell wall-associated NlpC family hydrolase/cell division protein FtsB